eukprot:2758035-Prymnesium_polylepis.1
MSSYPDLADALLGPGVRPLAAFRPPADMSPDRWYQHSGLTVGLAVHLAAHCPEDSGSYVLELGSFIGNSALTWARALRFLRRQNASVVCMDTCASCCYSHRDAHAAHLAWDPTPRRSR